MTRKQKVVISCSVLAIPLLLIGALVLASFFNVFHAHEHCIKGAGLAFRSYALDHYGKLPYHTNGFGNALLLLSSEGYLGETNCVGQITGPGDDGTAFKRALSTGQPIPESQCSRVYIQGLCETNNPNIAVLWDKKSCAGGDHFRRPWGRTIREVCLLDGSMQTISDERWPAFVEDQVRLLTNDGISEAVARHYYELH